MTRTDEIMNQIQECSKKALALFQSQEGLNSGDEGYLTYVELLEKWAIIQNEEMELIDSLLCDEAFPTVENTLYDNGVRKLYYVENDLVVYIDTILCDHAPSVFEFLDIAGITIDALTEKLGFEPDMDCFVITFGEES